MANTGKVIVHALKEVHSINGEQTGEIKVNQVGDPDYIDPYMDLVKCPVTTTLACPTVMATGATLSIVFEFGLPNSVLLNPSVATVRIKAMDGVVVVSSTDFTLPNSNLNYFSGTLTGLAASTEYTLEIDYLNGASTVIGNCPSLVAVNTL